MDLCDFKGSASVKEQLSRLEKLNRVPHAIIIEGSTREKRAELCDLLSMWAVCSSTGEKPCGACRGCVNAKNHRHSDIKIVSGSGKTDSVSVDAIREVAADCAVIPNEADRKVYIIYDADKRLSAISQNAFLKTLEEPPADAVFLLTCEDGGALLETVRSRSAVFTLENEYLYTDEEIKAAENIALGIISTNEYELLKTCFSLKNARQADITLEILSLLLRDGLAVASGGKAEISAQTASKLAKTLTRGKLLELNETVSSARIKIKQNVGINLLTTWLCAELRRTVWQK